MQIGIALSVYDKGFNHLPTVPRLSTNDKPVGPGPLNALLSALALTDLAEINADDPAETKGMSREASERAIPGFVCPSDPNRPSTSTVAPISYRATTGDDSLGRNGGFAPGRMITLAAIEQADGLSYSAAFSERLLGTGHDRERSETNYGKVNGPDLNVSCPAIETFEWSGDSGLSWAEASWRSTLYNHTLTPNAAPSCIDTARAAARVGASSGHGNGVNVLIFDGSVRIVGPRVSPEIWKALATTSGKAP